MKKRNFSGDLKVGVVMKLIKGEKTVAELCQEHNIVPGLIYKWRDHLIAKAPSLYDSPPENRQQENKIKKYESVDH